MGTGLFSSPLFITLICLVSVFALLSLLVSTLSEAVNSYFKERGRLLYTTISTMFSDHVNVNFGQLLYSHPAIDNLKKDKESLPQYISDDMFSAALIDVIMNYGRNFGFVPAAQLITQTGPSPGPFMLFQNGVNKMQNTPLKFQLLNMIERAIAAVDTDKISVVEKQIRQWYHDQMERTSGWYKTYIRSRLFWISLFVALALNVDSIHLFKTIYIDPDLRARLEPVAEQLADNYAQARKDSNQTVLQHDYIAAQLTKIMSDSTKKTDSSQADFRHFLVQWKNRDSLLFKADSVRQKTLQQAISQLDQISALSLPVGWKRNIPPMNIKWNSKGSLLSCLSYLLGILITAFSLSAGAPFWFDLLLRLVNIRRAGAKPNDDKK
jgi:hypothetical protein